MKSSDNEACTHALLELIASAIKNALQNVDFLNYWIIIIITKSLRTVMKMMMKTKLLKQFKVTKTLIL